MTIVQRMTVLFFTIGIVTTINAETEKVGDYTWQYFVRDGKAWIGSQQSEVAAVSPKPVGEVTVPSELGGYEVYRLDDNALYGCDEMTKLTIPDCVQQTGGSAFRNCSTLRVVHLPENLEYVAENAFRACSSLKEIRMPPNVCKIEAHAFDGCSSLTNIVLNGGIRRIGEQAFCGCNGLRAIDIPISVTNIEEKILLGCSNLESLTIPFVGSERGNHDVNTSLFGWLFAASQANGANCICVKQWFASGKSRTSYIPASLHSVTITDETLIPQGAFQNCSNLTSVVIGNSVTNITQGTFSGCGSLESITLPFVGSQRGNDKTGECAFGWIFGESTDSDKYFHVRQWVSGATFWCDIPKSLKSVVITDETVVAACSFDSCYNLENVVFGNSVTNIQDRVFAACRGLQRLTLPFVGATRDTPSGTKEAMFGYIFGIKSGEGLVQVRQSLGISGAEGWTTNYISAALTDVTITDERSLGYGSFYGCSMLTNVLLNSEIETIGGYAFRNCTGLRQIELPSELCTLDIAAFRGSGLEHVLVPLSVTKMNDRWTFEGCTSLSLAYVPRRFKGCLGYNTFANCSPDLQIIYYDESMRFFDETLRTEDNSSTNLVAVCTNDCRVSFKWKCSCEPMFKGNIYDYLSFEIDDVRQDAICGETDWQTKSYEVLGDGEHVFRWIYQKDEEGSVGEDCGWVKQVVVVPRVILSFDGGEATDGTPPAAMSFYADDESVVLPDCGTLSLAKHSFAGWSDGANTYTSGTVVVNTTLPKDGRPVSLTADWIPNELSTPVIVAPEIYEADSATVTITADEGATVYYTLDGSVPNPAHPGSTPYQGPFEIEGSATICAIAVMDNYYDSEVASFIVTRQIWTFGEYLNCPGRTFITDGDAEWVRVKGVSDDGYALRSGAITHSQTSRLETVVYGVGTVTFRYKADGEILKKIVYDGLAFCIDGMQQGALMGEVTWTNMSFAVTSDGRHTLSWLYVKDEEGSGDGEDCAWLDNVIWTADDPLPPLDVAATDSDAKAIIAGLSDVRLADTISNTTAYVAFRSWVDDQELSHALVKDAPNAWLSYVLDAPGLMAKSAALASEDVVIESIAPSGTVTGAFDLVVDIGGAEIGESARLAEALGIEGAAELNESEFSPDGLTVTLERTADGKAKATITPEGSPSAFFLRVKVK